MTESALPNDDEKYTCETCGRTWKNRAYLKQHQATCSLGKVTSFYLLKFYFPFLFARLHVKTVIWLSSLSRPWWTIRSSTSAEVKPLSISRPTLETGAAFATSVASQRSLRAVCISTIARCCQCWGATSALTPQGCRGEWTSTRKHSTTLTLRLWSASFVAIKQLLAKG